MIDHVLYCTFQFRQQVEDLPGKPESSDAYYLKWLRGILLIEYGTLIRCYGVVHILWYSFIASKRKLLMFHKYSDVDSCFYFVSLLARKFDVDASLKMFRNVRASWLYSEYNY